MNLKSALLILSLSLVAGIALPSTSSAKTMFGCKTPSNWSQASASKQQAFEAQTIELAQNRSQLPTVENELRSWVEKAKAKGDARAEAINKEGLAFIECLGTALDAGLTLKDDPIVQTAEFDQDASATQRLGSSASNSATSSGSSSSASGNSKATSKNSQGAGTASGAKTARSTTSKNSGGKTTTKGGMLYAVDTGQACITRLEDKPYGDSPQFVTRIRYQNSCDGAITFDVDYGGHRAPMSCYPGKVCDDICDIRNVKGNSCNPVALVNMRAE